MEQNQGFLTEEEEVAFNSPEPKVDELAPPAIEPEGEIKEPSPPESEVEPEVKVEEPKVEVKSEEQPSPRPEPEPTPIVDGILAKDGKHYMPFSVLEQERAKRQSLEAENAELRKPKVEVPKTPLPAPEKPQVDMGAIAKQMGIDFKSLADRAYESPEGMTEALEKMFTAGIQVASQVATTTSNQSALDAMYRSRVETIETQNPWLKTEVAPGLKGEDLAATIMNNRVRSDPNFPVNNLEAWVKVAEESVKEAKAALKMDAPPFDRETERKRITEEVTQQLMQKFNISKPKVTTLAGARNVNPDVISKFDQLDQLVGFEYEMAYGQLSPEEQEIYLRRAKT